MEKNYNKHTLEWNSHRAKEKEKKHKKTTKIWTEFQYGHAINEVNVFR